jgi:kinesin family protein C1
MENMQQMTPKESFQTPLKSTASERVHENQQANQHFKELVEKTNSFVNRSSKPPSELHSNGHIGAKTIEFLANRFNSERVRITAQKTDSKQRDPLSDSAQIYQIASDLKNKTNAFYKNPESIEVRGGKLMETLRGRDTANALMAVTEELNELKRRTTDIPKPQELQEEIKEKFSRLSKAIEEQELEKKDVLNKFRDKSVRESHRMHEMIESPPTGPSDKILEKLREELMEMQRKVAEAEMLRVHLEEEVRRKEQEQALLHQECSLVKLKLEKERREFDEQCRIEIEMKENARRELEEARRSRSQKKELLEQMKAALLISEQARIVTLSQLQEFRGNLRVYCRLKPSSPQEERAVVLKDKDHKEVQLVEASKKAKPTPYIFDHVFGETISQQDVFEQVEPFVQGTLDGKSISIFAYGPTGSGKTYTLEGYNPDSEKLGPLSGVLPRALDLITKEVSKTNSFQMKGDVLSVYLSCIEIYNERIGDLLAGKDKREEEVRIQLNNGKVILQGLVRRKVANIAEALETIKESSSRRQVEATTFNATSSRSHSIYRIAIVQNATNEELGLLNIIDMAGSEKNSFDNNIATGSKKQLPPDRLKKIQTEANFINKSLTTLGRIIRMIKEQRTSGIKDG